MSKSQCSTKISSLTDRLGQELRAESDQILYDSASVRGAISKASHSMCKKWNKTISYKKGDIVGLNGFIFISQREGNLAQNPLENRIFWSYLINPYATNFGKIKAFCIHNHNVILSSYNIDHIAVTQYDANSPYVLYANFYTYKFYFKTPFSNNPCFITNYPNYQIYNNVNIDLKNKAVQGVAAKNNVAFTEIYYTTATTDSSYNRILSTSNANYSSILNSGIEIGCVIWYANDEIIPVS